MNQFVNFANLLQYYDDVKISSVLCDDRFDNAVVRVNTDGFHPSVYYIQKGQSVLWTWKGDEEGHNIIHVKSPDSDVSCLITAHMLNDYTLV